MKTVEAVELLLADIGKDVDVAVKAGVAMMNDLLQVQIRQNDNESQKIKLQNSIDLVRLTIAQYCGLKSDVFTIDATDEMIDTVLLKPDDRFSLASLPEYQLLQKQVQATDIQRKIEIGKNLPTLGVGGGYNYHNVLGNNHTFGMVFATASIPISGWWGGSHAIKRKKIAQLQAEEQLEDNAELLKIRLQKSRNSVNESIRQLSITKRSIKQAEENMRLNRDYYKAGISKMSDLLEAQMLYQQALDKHTDAIADYRNKLIEYRQCSGVMNY
jgi:outer membrane protein TolC